MLPEKPVISLSKLREGITSFAYTLSSSSLEIENDCFKSPIEIKAEVESVEEDYYATLDIRTRGDFVCDRCGDAFQAQLAEKVHTFFTRDPEKLKEGDDDVRLLPPDALALDLTQDIRDGLSLAVPGKCLCRNDCRGLCPTCGANWNEETCSCHPEETDPRWDALKKLRFDKS